MANRSVKVLYPECYEVVKAIKANNAYYGTTNKDLCRVTRSSESTLARRFREPWTFTMRELTDIARLWGKTPTELMKGKVNNEKNM